MQEAVLTEKIDEEPPKYLRDEAHPAREGVLSEEAFKVLDDAIAGLGQALDSGDKKWFLEALGLLKEEGDEDYYVTVVQQKLVREHKITGSLLTEIMTRLRQIL